MLKNHFQNNLDIADFTTESKAQVNLESNLKSGAIPEVKNALKINSNKNINKKKLSNALRDNLLRRKTLNHKI